MGRSSPMFAAMAEPDPSSIIFGTPAAAMAIDAQFQPNGYYTLRMTSLAGTSVDGQPTDARQTLQQEVTNDDSTLTWRPLITDIKTLHWKFQDFNVTQWLDIWNSVGRPNLVEFSMKMAGDLQPTTMDFWVPSIATVVLTLPATHAP